ncbi:hypothetical protein A2U01_0053056, partial [Trifolium medium]|nr:hypothetical protein [Trifolium medium]
MPCEDQAWTIPGVQHFARPTKWKRRERKLGEPASSSAEVRQTASRPP